MEREREKLKNIDENNLLFLCVVVVVVPFSKRVAFIAEQRFHRILFLFFSCNLSRRLQI